ncbi:MAG: hypothetical protein NUV96_01625 [Candidatus Colwellbacteria bacterium]|nr:hypothetical protein [Candidatus Colwellbacteria bacterium]
MYEQLGKDGGEFPERETPNVDPFAAIAAIRGEIMTTGSVDFEPSALNQIEGDLRGGKIDGAEAIRRASAILANRQDYH